MLSDLAALTPPILVCAAFLIGVIAFLRHEMGRTKNSTEDASVEVSMQVPASPGENPVDSEATHAGEDKDDRESDS
jgi:hypothetical protein